MTDYSQIYRLYADELYAYGMAIHPELQLVEDAIHDVLLNMCERRVGIESLKNPKQYLLHALRYRLYYLVGKKCAYETIEANEATHAEGSAEDTFIKHEENDSLTARAERLKRRLTPRQREAVHLRLTECYTFEQIAEQMEISCQSAKNLFHEAIVRLRKEIITT